MSAKFTWRGFVLVALAHKRTGMLRACAGAVVLLLLPISCGGGASEQSAGTQTSVPVTTDTQATTVPPASTEETSSLASAYADQVEKAVSQFNTDLNAVLKLTQRVAGGDNSALAGLFQTLARLQGCSEVVAQLHPPPDFDDVQSLLSRSCKLMREGASAYSGAFTTGDVKAGKVGARKLQKASALLPEVRATLHSHS